MKIWLFSDTHHRHGWLDVPEGIDMALCSGDVGETKLAAINANEVGDFIEWFKVLPIKHKIFTPGNHDTSIERNYFRDYDFGDVTMLIHEAIEIEGLKIFASPYSPSFGDGWAYNKRRDKLHEYWQDIPNDTDILLTHTPPQGVCDITQDGLQVGCAALFKRVLQVQPRIHLFGHIHECAGWRAHRPETPNTMYVNGCIFDLRFQQKHNGVVVEL